MRRIGVLKGVQNQEWEGVEVGRGIEIALEISVLRRTS